MGNCPSGKENNGGLCYPPCPSGYDGVGPVCWAQCPQGFKDIGITCQKPKHGRGWGSVPAWCSDDHELQAGLCYPKCKPGYKGVSFVCWGVCPSGFTDTGFDCLKPRAYGRGSGHFSKKKCEKSKDHGASNGCEKNGLFWYPKCDPGYHNFGCCICSPNCPSGFTDVGISCQKPSYTRGVGKIPGCNPATSEKNGALCYPKCEANFDGVGPVCWGKCTPNTTDTGVDCLKKTKTRGVGTIPHPNWTTILILIIVFIVFIVAGGIILRIALKK